MDSIIISQKILMTHSISVEKVEQKTKTIRFRQKINAFTSHKNRVHDSKARDDMTLSHFMIRFFLQNACVLFCLPFDHGLSTHSRLLILNLKKESKNIDAQLLLFLPFLLHGQFSTNKIVNI